MKKKGAHRVLVSQFRAERLVAARSLLDRTQGQVGDAANLPQSLISMIESGQRSFTEDHAVAIARAMELPMEFFSVRSRSIPFDSLRFRKNRTSSTKTSQRVHVLFQEAFRVVEDLVRENLTVPRPVLPLVQDPESILSQDRIEKLASMARESLRLAPDLPIPSMTRSLERAGFAVAPVILPSIGESPRPHEPGHFGVSYWGGRGEPGLIGYFQGSGDRERFTLAHELAHAVLHSNRDSDDAEDEANRFASAFLVPRERALQIITSETTLRTLAIAKADWGVSIQALVMRGKQIGALPEERAAALFKQIASRGWRKKEPVEVTVEPPRLFRELLVERFGNEFERDKSVERKVALPMLVLRSLAPAPSRRSGARAESRAGVIDLAAHRARA